MPSPACNHTLNSPPKPHLSRRSGFTLIEMAVALVVLALVLGSMLAPLSAQLEQRKISEAQKTLDQINDALMGFSLSQTPSRLPCPDTDGDGIEEAFGSAGCLNNNTTSSWGGNVPWATLGVPATDQWGQRYQYRVNGAFVGTISLTSTGSGAGIVRVCGENTCAAANMIASNVPAVVYSAGPNGAQQPPSSPDELENVILPGNAKYDRTFVSHTYSTVVGAEFDDIVTYLSSNILINRLVSAQKLP